MVHIEKSFANFSSEKLDAAGAVGVLVVQQVAGIVGQGAVGGGDGGAVKQHGVAGQNQIILRDVILYQGCAVEHGEAVAQAAQGVVHAGHVVGAVGIQRLVSTGGAVVDLDVLYPRRAGGRAGPDVLVVGLDGVGQIGVDLIGGACNLQETAVLLARTRKPGAELQSVLDLGAGQMLEPLDNGQDSVHLDLSPHPLELVGIAEAAGKYTLREETAPDGYLVAKDVEFEVKDTDEVQHVTMVDEEKPAEKTPEGGKPVSDSPKTGDNTNLWLWFMLLGIGATGTGALAFMRKKKH